MLILVLVQSGAGLRKRGLTQPTVQLYVTPGCLYCLWNVHVKPKDSWMLYVLYCEFFVLQKTKLRAMLDKVPRLSRDIPLAFSASESTRAARCPCLLISLSQRERSEILDCTGETESWSRAAATHHSHPLNVKSPSVWKWMCLLPISGWDQSPREISINNYLIIVFSCKSDDCSAASLSGDKWEAGKDQCIA